MNVVLIKEMILKENLEWEEATQLLTEANKSPAAEHIVFHINSERGSKWRLVGNCKELNKLFLDDPDKFVIKGA